jgi:hypothetical protein
VPSQFSSVASWWCTTTMLPKASKCSVCPAVRSQVYYSAPHATMNIPSLNRGPFHYSTPTQPPHPFHPSDPSHPLLHPWDVYFEYVSCARTKSKQKGEGGGDLFSSA